jgi:hypothetical protein
MAGVFFSGRVSWPRTSGPLVEVAAQALDDARRDVLSELDHTPVEVTRPTPLNLDGTFSVRPILHEPFGVANVAGRDFSTSGHRNLLAVPRDDLPLCDAVQNGH